MSEIKRELKMVENEDFIFDVRSYEHEHKTVDLNEFTRVKGPSPPKLRQFFTLRTTRKQLIVLRSAPRRHLGCSRLMMQLEILSITSHQDKEKATLVRVTLFLTGATTASAQAAI
jgi:hypothetical protein